LQDPLFIRKKMRAAEIEAELMRRLATHPGGANVAWVHVTGTNEQPPSFTWHLAAVTRHDTQVAAAPIAEEVARELQQEVDLLEDDANTELAERYEIAPIEGRRISVTGKALRDRGQALSLGPRSVEELVAALRHEVIAAARRKATHKDLEADGSIIVDSTDGLGKGSGSADLS
jgi:hypothetical protein